IKTIISQRAEGKTGEIYLGFRAQAEVNAREKAGKDIGLDAIYTEFSSLSGFSAETVNQLRQLEESVEFESVTPRPEAVALLNLAITLGKRVLLVSDMYLPKGIIENML